MSCGQYTIAQPSTLKWKLTIQSMKVDDGKGILHKILALMNPIFSINCCDCEAHFTMFHYKEKADIMIC